MERSCHFMQSVCKLQDEQLQLTITDHDQLRSCWVLKSNHEPFGPSRLRLAKQKTLTKADVFSTFFCTLLLNLALWVLLFWLGVVLFLKEGQRNWCSHSLQHIEAHRRKASARQWQLFWDQIFFPLPCGCPKRAMVIKTDLCSYTE